MPRPPAMRMHTTPTMKMHHLCRCNCDCTTCKGVNELAAVERFNVTVGRFAAADAHNTIAAAIAAACSTINEAALAQAFRNI